MGVRMGAGCIHPIFCGWMLPKISWTHGSSCHWLFQPPMLVLLGGLSLPVLLRALSHLHNATHLQLVTETWKNELQHDLGETTAFSKQAKTSSVGVTVTSL